jgi:hypothetical protein
MSAIWRREKTPNPPPVNHFKWLQQPGWAASGETFLARANSCLNRGVIGNVLAPVCRSLNADVDRGVKRCSGVGTAGAVSMFKRYFSAQLGSTPRSSKTVDRYFPKVPGPGRLK